MTKFLVMALSTFFLAGCDNYNEMKDYLQTSYDATSNNRAICYRVGDITYPHLDEPVTFFKKPDWNDAETEYNKKTLPLFEKVGLIEVLSSGTGADGKNYPIYTLTELGKQYTWSYRQPGAGGKKGFSNESYFCFGHRVIVEVTEINHNTTRIWGAKTKEDDIVFTYKIENSPDWARSPVLSHYGSELYSDPEKILSDRVTLAIKKDGGYYNIGSGNKIGSEMIR